MTPLPLDMVMARMMDPARLSLTCRGHGFVQSESSLPFPEQASILCLVLIPGGPLPPLLFLCDLKVIHWLLVEPSNLLRIQYHFVVQTVATPDLKYLERNYLEMAFIEVRGTPPYYDLLPILLYCP